MGRYQVISCFIKTLKIESPQDVEEEEEFKRVDLLFL